MSQECIITVWYSFKRDIGRRSVPWVTTMGTGDCGCATNMYVIIYGRRRCDNITDCREGKLVVFRAVAQC
jgi:hypothetical protein